LRINRVFVPANWLHVRRVMTPVTNPDGGRRWGVAWPPRIAGLFRHLPLERAGGKLGAPTSGHSRAWPIDRTTLVPIAKKISLDALSQCGQRAASHSRGVPDHAGARGQEIFRGTPQIIAKTCLVSANRIVYRIPCCTFHRRPG
jgi:hypothetical protein